ncbi:MAG: right-handed parallel beta-helix repeat-containing protein [Bacteroidota bacterium]
MRSVTTLLLLFTLTVSSFSTTLKVPQDYAKIQLAINAAVNGDTILVAEGTYFENLVINKKIVLGSLFIVDNDTSHIRKTIIDGGSPSNIDSSSCIFILAETDTNTVIKGLTLQNGRGTKGTYHDIIWRCGGGIFIYAGGATIVHNIIRDNDCNETTINAGGALDIWPDSTYTHGPKHWVIAYNSIIDNNRAAMSWGLMGEGGGAVLMGHGKFYNNVVRNNTSSGQVFGIGAGIQIYSDIGNTDIEFRNNLIVNNSASLYAGGICSSPDPSYTIRAAFYNNIISGNTAAQNAAFRVGLGDYTFVNNTITGNISTNALWFTSASGSYSYKFMNNIIWNPSCPVEFNSTARIIAAYNCVRGGLAGIGNISTDPLFVADDSLYRLEKMSPAIGTGTKSITLGGTLITSPSTDRTGSLRPNPSWGSPDLGATESPIALPGVTIIRVPQDQPTIQKGINTASAGEIVLVSEGTFTENLVITKKQITVASLFFIDKDTSHISKTIIDGSAPSNPDSGSVISIRNVDTTVLITGFTITKGSGNKHVNPHWNPSTTALTCAGIEMNGGGMTIRHNIITGNTLKILPPATEGWGGGIGVYDIDVPGSTTYSIIESNVISNNSIIGGTQNGGGGIDMIGSGRIINNTILGNSSMYSINTAVQTIASKMDTAFIENNLIQGNSVINTMPGFVVGGSGMTANVRNNVIIDNVAGGENSAGCWVLDNCRVVVECNFIARNGGNERHHGILLQTSGESLIQNNIIANNSGTGIYVFNSLPSAIVNNTSVGNSRYGFYSTSVSYLLNNILWNNTLGSISPNSLNFNTAYNLISGGPLSTDDIDSNPKFRVNDSLYHFLSGSPCNGKGRMSAKFGGVTINAPITDYFNLPRPQQPNSPAVNPDLGAAEMNYFVGVEGVKELSIDIPIDFSLSQNYPNPFNPSTTIRYALPSSSHVKLTINDILGREIATLVNEEQTAGWKEVQWNANSVSSGIYFYKLTANTFVETKRMMMLK